MNIVINIHIHEHANTMQVMSLQWKVNPVYYPYPIVSGS